MVDGPHAIQALIEAEASTMPKPIAAPKLNCQRSANANGMKNGNPSGTRINVSLAMRESCGRLRCSNHPREKARMLVSGNDNSNAPHRGDRCPTWDAATMIKAVAIVLRMVFHTSVS